MGNRHSKSSMSGQYSVKGSQGPTMVGTKKNSLTTNGNGPPPLIYDPPDDENMNEIIDEDISLTVVLPNGTRKEQTVKPSIPMMDLLVNLAASNKLNPASHSLVVLTDDKWKQIDFKANKTIGLLAGDDKSVSVQIIPRKTEEKYKAKSVEKPFELTCRFTVNLPGKQKKVLRISPKVSLGEVRLIICKEKGFDPSQYVFRLPGSPTETVTDDTLVGDFKTNEIDFISIGMMEAAAVKSLPELAQATSKTLAQSNRNTEEGYMPSAGEKKAKRGFLSMLGKKEKKFKLDTQVDPGAAGKRKTQSFNVHNRENDPQMRPKSMFVTSGDNEIIDVRRTTGNLQNVPNTRNADFRKSTGGNLVPVSEIFSQEVRTENSESAPDTSQTLPKTKKKKAAPPPPQQKQNIQQTVQVEIEVKPKEVLEDRHIEEISDNRIALKKMHSRNSSDSSGYHELTLSGAESPEGAKFENLQTTLDTTSIDSGEHAGQFNGDSGIRDMSPLRQHEQGDIAKGADPDVRLSQEGPPVAPGRKKKRAPLPPPGMSATKINNTAQKDIDQPQVSIETHKNEENEALRAMEEVTMRFNIDSDGDEDMKMVENSSIHSEDIDLDIRRQRPPCNFVAPPPPTEPPPDDSEPVSLSLVVNQVNTIDIGVGEDTTSPGPDSIKNSPLHSRRGSNSSNSSVNTLEDLSLAFKLTIAMGEEALDDESEEERVEDNTEDIPNQAEGSVQDIPNETVEDKLQDFSNEPVDEIVQDIPNETTVDSVQDELEAALPEFKQKISSLAAEDSTEDGSPTGESLQSNTSEEQGTELEVTKDTALNTGEISIDEVEESPKGAQGNRDSSEITYDLTIDVAPPGFEEKEAEQEKQSGEESEEEITETVEEVTYTYQRPVNIEVVEVSSPRRIPDLESPKEHKTISLPSREVLSEIPIDNSTPKESVQKSEEITLETNPPKTEEKEEFVISLDELSSIDFSASVPGQKNKDQTKRSQSFDDGDKVSYRIEFVKAEPIQTEDGVIVPDAVYIGSEGEDDVDGSFEAQNESFEVKNKCSELSFSPNGEGEVEHVMEEKSISMIALQAERTPVSTSEMDITADSGISEPDTQTFASSTKIVLSQSNDGGKSSREPTPRKSSREVSPGRSLGSPRMEENSDTQQQNLLQAQYQQLQEQFTMWQTQLIQNQKLLASQGHDTDFSTNQMTGSDSQSNLQFQQLQIQMQMQQQMMLQLQQSMQALTLQQALAASQPAQQVAPPVVKHEPVTQSVAKRSESGRSREKHEKHEHKSTRSPEQAQPVAPRAPPPPEAAKPKVVKADAKYSKPKQKKYERPLDPREQLMLDIRNRGRAGLKKVPVKATHWHK